MMSTPPKFNGPAKLLIQQEDGSYMALDVTLLTGVITEKIHANGRPATMPDVSTIHFELESDIYSIACMNDARYTLTKNEEEPSS